jgi:H+/Cl- antiporter ClcA
MVGEDMLQKYKEIFYGLAFGILAVVLDTALDATAEGRNYAGQVAAHPAMMLYRLSFILLGLAFGYLLRRNHKRERELRHLTEILQRVKHQCATQALLMSSKLQVLLTRDDLHLSDEDQRLLREAYQNSQELQRMA